MSGDESTDSDEDDAAPTSTEVPSLPTANDDEIARRIAEISAKVPWIGEAWRWYDVPYRVLSWAFKPKVRRMVPWKTRRFLNRCLNFFIPFNEFDRQVVTPLDDAFDNLHVPEGESVEQGGVWLIELFPPSQYGTLVRSLNSNGWDRHDELRSIDGSNASQVEAARTGQGYRWWRLGTIADRRSHYVGVFVRENLPDEFSLIELTAYQLGRSLTAVVAHFQTSDSGATALNGALHRRYEPQLVMRGLRRPGVLSRRSAATRAIQAERLRLHNTAREWLTRRCPGAFAGSRYGQPAVDLTLFTEFDPELDEPGRDMSNCLQALGMDDMGIDIFVSPSMPGFTFVPVSRFPDERRALRNCWGVVAKRSRANELHEASAGYGDPPFGAATFGHMFRDEIRAFLLHVAVEGYVNDLERSYARARDLARTKYSRISARRVRELRADLLTLSLDLPMVAKDVASLWEDPWLRRESIEVFRRRGPGRPVLGEDEAEEDIIRAFGEISESRLKELVEIDATYRGVLSTVASLGASIDASRLGRRALVVAGASLVVAVLTLLVANTGSHTLWSSLIDSLR